MLSFLLRQREVFPSFPRRRETRFVLNLWIPALAASAGMTFVCVLMKKLTDTMEDHKFLKIRVIMAALLVATLSACMVVGPDYVRPTVITPDAYKENDGWKVAQPKDDLIRGAWWEIFGDPQLNALAAQVSVSNQNLAAAEAQYREAQALVREARASYFPTATIGIGANRSSQSTTIGGGPTSQRTAVSDYSLALDVSWELDVWGRIRRSVESNQASAQASAGDLENARLSFQAALAQDYFQLRELDAQKQLLTETVAAFQKFLELTEGLYAQGVDSEVDVQAAETQLKTTQAQLINVGVQRAQFEHAIAVLIGKPASDFSIPATPLAGTPPAIPVGVPSELLERRPDIAASERRVAAANAQIGVAEAAFYPSVTLNASLGLESSSLAKLFTAASRFWSVGASVSETVYDGGLRRAHRGTHYAHDQQQHSDQCEETSDGYSEIVHITRRSG